MADNENVWLHSPTFLRHSELARTDDATAHKLNLTAVVFKLVNFCQHMTKCISPKIPDVHTKTHVRVSPWNYFINCLTCILFGVDSIMEKLLKTCISEHKCHLVANTDVRKCWKSNQLQIFWISTSMLKIKIQPQIIFEL